MSDLEPLELSEDVKKPSTGNPQLKSLSSKPYHYSPLSTR